MPQPPRLHRRGRGLLKLGANALFLNTAFSGPQLTEVAKREKPKALDLRPGVRGGPHDAERGAQRYIAWHEPDAERDRPALEELIERGDRADVTAAGAPGKAIILTSGTTGTPKGASRSQPKSLDPAAALLSGSR